MKLIRFMFILSALIVVHNNVQAVITADQAFDMVEMVQYVQAGLNAPISLVKAPIASASVSTSAGASTVTAPYPTTIYSTPVTLAVGQTITTFDYSMDFTGAQYGTQLYVSQANLALIPAGASVVFTGNAVANSSGGYDAVVTAYNPTTQQPYFTQTFSPVMQFSGITPSTVTTNQVPSTATWNNTYVLYSLSNGVQNQVQNIGINFGFSFVGASVPAPVGASTVTAPYPTTIYSTPATLAAGQTITTFDYSMDFTGAPYGTQLYVSQANLALIPAGASVVFTGNAVANSSGGYDAVVTAYNPTTQQPYFTQTFSPVMQFTGTDPSTVTTNQVPSTATWNNTYVLYSLSNGVQNQIQNIGTNFGFSFVLYSLSNGVQNQAQNIGTNFGFPFGGA